MECESWSSVRQAEWGHQSYSHAALACQALWLSQQHRTWAACGRTCCQCNRAAWCALSSMHVQIYGIFGLEENQLCCTPIYHAALLSGFHWRLLSCMANMIDRRAQRAFISQSRKACRMHFGLSIAVDIITPTAICCTNVFDSFSAVLLCYRSTGCQIPSSSQCNLQTANGAAG